jgi:hypothetical protein
MLAATLTIVLMVYGVLVSTYFPDTDALMIPVAILGIPFELGVLLAALPYGGLYNNPPLVRVAVIASVINAALWGGLVYSLKSLRDFLRGTEA